jgi:hypothetical protein
MKLPALFRRENSNAALRERQDQVEKMFARSLRGLGTLLGKLADVVDNQRLKKNGFGPQEKFLERLDRKKE